MRASTRPTRLLHAALLAALFLLAPACDRASVQIDPAVVERPLPRPDDPVDPELVRAGSVLFQRNCAACHRMEGDAVVGPALGDVVARRGAAWVRGMVLEPDSMLRHDPAAQALLQEYRVPMPDTGLDEARFRAVLEFLRSGEGSGADEAAGGEPR